MIGRLIKSFVHRILQIKGRRLFAAGVTVHGPFTVICPENVHAKAGLHINHDVLIHGGGGVYMGSDVILSAGVKILTVTLDIGGLTAAERRVVHVCKAINIGDRVWIGAGAIVLPGVSIGLNAIVAAGSVVTRSVGANELVAGNPARLVRKLKVDGKEP